MDIFQKDIVTIIRSALTGIKGTLSDGFDLEKGIKLAREHNIIAIFYEGAVLCGVSDEIPMMQNMINDVCKTVIVDARQISMINRLTEAFDKEYIDYLPLKGILLKQFYPKSEMRAMGDADILIKLEQYSKIQEILKDLDFLYKYESDHELVWTNPSLFLELHKSVMTTYNKDFYKYFSTGWDLASKVDGTNSRYEFKPEDFYVYIFVHFTKHYRISGIGIKHILDLWVYAQAHPQVDWSYIHKILKQLNLYEFHHNVIDTLNVWFDNGEQNEKTSLITNVIFSSGQYGTLEMSNINLAIRESKNNGSESIKKTKIRQLCRTLFPSYKSMKNQYPFLGKVPLAFPFMWVYRWCEILIFKRKNIGRYMHNLNAIKQSTVDANLNALRLVGLNFNSEE